MGCDVRRVDGLVIIACGPKKRCCVPHCRMEGSRLCDHVLGNGVTCDAPICLLHRDRITDDIDFCPAHSSERRIP